MLEWKKLLCKDRIQNIEGTKGFDYDLGVILSSQSFRALQDKTQVYPLDKGDYVHTRLTHSLEVSSVAQRISEMIFKDYDKFEGVSQEVKNHIENSKKENENLVDDVKTIASIAGLLHDMGNPPFGHYGESMISTWFKKYFDENDIDLTDEQKADFEHFEGNAQALRLLTKVAMEPKNAEHFYNINVSKAVINSVVKYPNPSIAFNIADDVKRIDKKNVDVRRHKNGYYCSEANIYKDVAMATGTYLEDEEKFVRHPITYIMEAADDISYMTADIADSISKEIFDIKQFATFFYEHYLDELVLRMKIYIENDQVDAIRKKLMEGFYNKLLPLTGKGRSNGIRDIGSIHKFLHECYPRVGEMQEHGSIFSDNRDGSVKSTEEGKRFIDDVKKFIIPLEKIKELETSFDGIDYRSGRALAIIEDWLESLREECIKEAAQGFLQNYFEIMDGSFPGDLFSKTGNSEIIKLENDKSYEVLSDMFSQNMYGFFVEFVKKPMEYWVYDCTELVKIEVASKRIFEELLTIFTDVMMKYVPKENSVEEEKGKKMGVVYDRILKLIPEKLLWDFVYTKDYINSPESGIENKEQWILYYKLLTVTDFISGMTDSYAENLYKTVSGYIS